MNARLNAAKQFCLRGHPLSGANLYLSLSRGAPMRQCRACRSIRRPKAAPGHTLDSRALARRMDALEGGESTHRELAARFGVTRAFVAHAARGL